ncbi:MAG: hypothetical protein CL454_00790 [Acidimicrobiaceae bacterium]|nr:hypothetical protein [Acidimicrobiaceae bacterium]
MRKASQLNSVVPVAVFALGFQNPGAGKLAAFAVVGVPRARLHVPAPVRECKESRARLQPSNGFAHLANTLCHKGQDVLALHGADVQ